MHNAQGIAIILLPTYGSMGVLCSIKICVKLKMCSIKSYNKCKIIFVAAFRVLIIMAQSSSLMQQPVIDMFGIFATFLAAGVLTL